jgi:hypothetical protein
MAELSALICRRRGSQKNKLERSIVHLREQLSWFQRLVVIYPKRGASSEKLFGGGQGRRQILTHEVAGKGAKLGSSRQLLRG